VCSDSYETLVMSLWTKNPESFLCRYAPNQVCSDSYENTISRHVISVNIEGGNETKPVKDMSQV
jgi:hypothetical protein